MDHFETNFASPWNFLQKNLGFLKFPMVFLLSKWDPCQFLGYTFVSKISIIMYLYICKKMLKWATNFKVKIFLNKIISRDVYCLYVSSFLTCHIAILALQKKVIYCFVLKNKTSVFDFWKRKLAQSFPLYFLVLKYVCTTALEYVLEPESSFTIHYIFQKKLNQNEIHENIQMHDSNFKTHTATTYIEFAYYDISFKVCKQMCMCILNLRDE